MRNHSLFLERRNRIQGAGGLSSLVLAGLLALLGSPAVAGEWRSAGLLSLPQYNYSYLAATPAGDLLAATFNVDQTGGQARPMPALLIRNPLSAKPEVVELCTTTFEAARGYGGIACDSAGNFYLSGDTGNPDTSFIRKFQRDGSPDPSFGDNGEVKPRRRCLGLDALGDYLFLAIDWGQVAVLDARTGRYLGSVPPAPSNPYVRDIAIDPTSMRIYGVAAGNVVVWERGAPWDPSSYQYRHLAAAPGRVRSGEGISFDPVDRAALITPIPGNTLLRVPPDGQALASTLSSAQPTTQIGDSVLSFDGTTLFVSDFNMRGIHVMRREDTTPSAPTASAPPPAYPPITASSGAAVPSTAAGPVQWNRSYMEVVENARRQGHPMVVYFRRDGIPKCEEFEKGVLLTETFNRQGQNFSCVFEDTAYNTLLAYRFGIFRVPQVVLLDSRGEVTKRFIYSIDPSQMFEAMQAVR